jgi:hypothetical protein
MLIGGLNIEIVGLDGSPPGLIMGFFPYTVNAGQWYSWPLTDCGSGRCTEPKRIATEDVRLPHYFVGARLSAPMG